MKIINFFIPFLMEMLFGKKDDKIVLSRKDVWKRRIVYAVMVISFSVNYVLAGKVYSLAAAYIALKKKADTYESAANLSDSYKMRADQLDVSLQFCMRMAYSAPTVPSRRMPQAPPELSTPPRPPEKTASAAKGK